MKNIFKGLSYIEAENLYIDKLQKYSTSTAPLDVREEAITNLHREWRQYNVEQEARNSYYNSAADIDYIYNN